jgi:hypothetical protein
MQFGDTNTPDTLNQVTNMMLQPCLGGFASIFFDDVQLFSPSRKAHLRHIRILLTTLHWYRFYLGKSKLKWFARSLLSLGALITDDGVAVDLLKWDKIANWPTPRNKKDVLFPRDDQLDVRSPQGSRERNGAIDGVDRLS